VPLLDSWNLFASRDAEKVVLWHPEAPGGLSFGEIDHRSREIEPHGHDVVACGESLDFFPTLIAAWRAEKPVILIETARSTVHPIHGPIPDGTALIKQTCGASGIERSLFFTADQVLAEARRNIDGLGLHEGRRGLAAISLAHSYGFGCLALPFLVGGIPLEIVPGPLPMFMHGALAKGGEIFLPGVPAIWKTWWQTGIAADPAITLAICAGSPLSLELEQSIFAECGLKVRNFYGTSETGAISFDRSDAPRTSAESVGTPLPGIEVSTDGDGRIHVTSDACAAGSDFPVSDEEFTSGPYRTHDIGGLCDGDILIKNCDGGAINVAGRKVSPLKLRAILEASDGVVSAEIARGSSRDFERFEEIRVHVRITPDADPKHIREVFRRQTESWEMPRKWEFETLTRRSA
jgi:long-chain acyl-CoA synthetase